METKPTYVPSYYPSCPRGHGTMNLLTVPDIDLGASRTTIASFVCSTCGSQQSQQTMFVKETDGETVEEEKSPTLSRENDERRAERRSRAIATLHRKLRQLDNTLDLCLGRIEVTSDYSALADPEALEDATDVYIEELNEWVATW